MNVTRLIWAFNYAAATDPATGQPEKVDTWNYAKVRLRLQSSWNAEPADTPHRAS